MDIWWYVAEHSEEAADHLYEKFQAAAQRVADFPQSQRERKEFGPGIRVVPVGRFALCYREVDIGIEVVRVIHAARDLRRVLGAED